MLHFVCYFVNTFFIFLFSIEHFVILCYNLLKHSAKDQCNMLKEERIDFILTRLKNNDFIKIKDIANQLDVSTMTIRRDLDELEKDNLQPLE